MSLDGFLLAGLCREIDRVLPLKINKIAQIDEQEIVFECFGQGKKQVLFSTDSNHNRINLISRSYTRLAKPNAFVMLLRKYLEGGYIKSIQQVGLDRVVALTITNRNSLGDVVDYQLMVELMGKYANLILVDQGLVLDALHRLYPSATSPRTLLSKAPYQAPDRFDKKDPRLVKDPDLSQPLFQQFEGFSPLLAKEVTYRLQQGQDFSDILHLLFTSENLYLYDKQVAHLIELDHLHQKANAHPLCDGLELLYQRASVNSFLKNQLGDLNKKVKRELKKNQRKLDKLTIQYHQAQDYQHFKDIGDLLLTYGQSIPSGQKQVELLDYNNQMITIDLDPRYNGIDNSQLYFKTYRKQKTSLSYLMDQIEETQQKISYFDGLLFQLDHASSQEAQEIYQELEPLFSQKIPKRKDGPAIKIHHTSYQGVDFYYGKSNLQNNELTFKKAHKDYWWFHVADGPGSHVVCFKDQVDEGLIRFGANLAALHSKYAQSSSVAVHYTQIRNIKKIPKAPLGMVSLNHPHTIFIDPQEIETKENDHD